MSLLTGSDLKIINTLIAKVQELEEISNRQSTAILDLIKFSHTHSEAASGAITTNVSTDKQDVSSRSGDSHNPNEGEKRSGSAELSRRAEGSEEKGKESLGKGLKTSFGRTETSDESSRLKR